MENRIASSSKAAYGVVKTLAAIGVVACGCGAFVIATAPPSSELGPLLRWGLVLGCIVGAGLAAMVGLRFAYMEYDDARLTIIRNGSTTHHEWSEIASVFQVIGLTPPVYQIVFRSGSPPAYVIMRGYALLSIIVWSWDFTGFVDYARSRIVATQQQLD